MNIFTDYYINHYFIFIPYTSLPYLHLYTMKTLAIYKYLNYICNSNDYKYEYAS